MRGDEKRQDRSIGWRINSLLAKTVLFAMAVLGVGLSVYQVNSGINARRHALENTGYVFASAIAEGVGTGNREAIDQVFHAAQHLPDVVGVYAVGADGKVIASGGSTVILSHAMAGQDPTGFLMLSRGLLPVSVDIVRGGEVVGRLVMVGDISGLRLELLQLVAATLLAAGLSVPLAMLFGFQLQRRVTAPIKELTATIKGLRQRHHYEVARISGAEGETLELVESFNEMVSEIQRRDRDLYAVAYIDSLTGLFNRAHFMRELDSWATGGSLPDGSGVFLFDVSKFSLINNTLGQIMGDQLLRAIASRLSSQLPAGSVLARYGSSTFALMVAGLANQTAAQDYIAPLVAAFFDPVDVGGQAFNISLQVGFAVAAPGARLVPAELLRRAGLAVAESKRAGSGRIVGYQSQFGMNAEEEAELERGLHRALERGEIQVHYQPIVRIGQSRVTGFEALLRWQRPDGRMVPPTRFVPIAEQNGLISKLGEWVLLKACQDAKAWASRGLPRRFVSVNVSAAQIMADGFAHKVKAILQKTGLPPDQLILELTESLFAGQSMSQVRLILGELHALGVKTALDDFGTGYSSLSYLEHLSFDKLKIDRSFVRGDTASAARKPLLAGIVNIAKALGATVVAEGAETPAEIKLLHDLGVDEVQGYYFSKPLREEEALARAAAIDSNAAGPVAVHRGA